MLTKWIASIFQVFFLLSKAFPSSMNQFFDSDSFYLFLCFYFPRDWTLSDSMHHILPTQKLHIFQDCIFDINLRPLYIFPSHTDFLAHCHIILTSHINCAGLLFLTTVKFKVWVSTSTRLFEEVVCNFFAFCVCVVLHGFPAKKWENFGKSCALFILIWITYLTFDKTW